MSVIEVPTGKVGCPAELGCPLREIRIFQKSVLCMLGLLAASLGNAFAEQDDSGAPPRATILMANYQGQLRPVVSVKVDRAQVMVNGKLETLSLRQTYLPLRASSHLAGFVEIKSEDIEGEKLQRVWQLRYGKTIDGDTISAYNDLEGVLVSNTTIKDSYIAILFFNTAYMRGEESDLNCAIVFHSVGDLEAGKEKKVSFQFENLSAENQNLTFFTLLFSQGYEVRTSQSAFGDRFFRTVELSIHQRLLKAYVDKHSKGDQALQPYLKAPLELPDELNRESLPSTVQTSFTVTAQGRVECVELNTPVPEEVKLAIGQNLRSWLFMPRICDGHPVSTTVLLPIGLR
jgi:hypothetical protein